MTKASLRRGTAMKVFNGPDPVLKDDPAKMVESIQKAFADFQAANDNRLKALEAGKDDIVTKNEVDKINNAITDLKRAMDDRAKEMARLELAGGGSGKVVDLRAHAARFETIRNRGKKKVRPENANVEAYQAYKNAFEDLCRMQFNTDNAAADIRNSMSVGSDPDGGYLVPDEMSTEMEKRLFDTSPMRQIARVISISANAWEAPYKSSDATSGGWVGEKASRTATATPTVGMQRIQTFEQYAYPEVTQTMLDDAAIPVESFIVDETEDKMGRTENTAFVTGDGVIRPRGFADYASAAVTTNDATRAWGALQYVASGAAGAFSGTDKLITLMSKLHPNYRQGAVWTMNRSTEATVRQLKDGDGRYLVGFGDLRDSPFNFSLLGTEIVNLEDMADIASNSYSVAYGNFKRGYLIIDRTGFRVLRDPYTNKPYVGFYITKRVGGDVRNFDAIKLMKFAAS